MLHFFVTQDQIYYQVNSLNYMNKALTVASIVMFAVVLGLSTVAPAMAEESPEVTAARCLLLDERLTNAVAHGSITQIVADEIRTIYSC